MIYDTTHFKTFWAQIQVLHMCFLLGHVLYDRNITIFFPQADFGVALLLYKTYKTQQVKSTNNKKKKKKNLNSHDC